MKIGINVLLSFTLILSLMLALSVQTTSAEGTGSTEQREGITLKFDDSDEAKWANEYIGEMKAKNVLSGYPDGTFRPNQPVNRAEAIVTAVRLMGLEEEAKSKTASDVTLHFKDASLIDKKYPWAKGYILVALENGLFDASEEKIQPDKPASRVWVSSLLVRSLGLQSEALKQMTTIPDFKDANEIPAGSIGFINVAIEQELITGFPDNTFQPNKNVTRAQMAALLGRTGENLLENEGAITVQGKITDIKFGESGTEGASVTTTQSESSKESGNTETVTNESVDSTSSNAVETSQKNVTPSNDTQESNSEDVDLTQLGNISIETVNGESFTYNITSELLIKFNDRFIRADQLLVGDVVTLVVQEGKVIEASFVGEELSEEMASGIIELKVKAELKEDSELKLKYKNKDGKIRAEIEKGSDDSKEKISGEEAATTLNAFINKLGITPDMTQSEILDQVLLALELDTNSFEELEIEIKFSNGKKVEIEQENERDEEKEEFKRDEDSSYEGYKGIFEFKLNLKTVNDSKLKLEYGNEEANIETSEEEVQGDQAAKEIEAFLDELALSEDMDKEEILKQLLIARDLDIEQIKELELEIKFTSGKVIEFEFENED